MRALVIGNDNDNDSGYVGARFAHHGYTLHECLRERPDDWPQLDGHDLVLLLGSEWSVYWEQNEHNTAVESALVQEAHSTGVPVFGICYGSQMVAHALGGSVERASLVEIGWYHVDSRMPEIIAAGPWLQWHYDRFIPPAEAEVLATSPAGCQAIQLGRTFATQFHPEVDEGMLTKWVNSDTGVKELSRLGTTAETLLDATREHVKLSQPNAARIVDWFLDNVS